MYGVSVKVYPAAFGQSATNKVAIRRVWSATFPDSTSVQSPDDTKMLNAPDFRVHPVTTPCISRYYKVGKYVKRQGDGWLLAG